MPSSVPRLAVANLLRLLSLSLSGVDGPLSKTRRFSFGLTVRYGLQYIIMAFDMAILFCFLGGWSDPN